MREIKFRGQQIDNSQWVYGHYFENKTHEEHIIMSWTRGSHNTYEVKPDTIGQYTGLKDKDGKEIYEGDICKYYNPEDKDGICEIKEDYALWISGTIKETNLITALFYLKCSSEWEVIGNIYENPELLRAD